MEPATLYSERTQLQFTNTLSLGSYHLFNCKIQLKHKGDSAVFLHEYWHHLQNSTTLLGAERFHYFFQLLGQIAKLSEFTTEWYLPLSKWVQSSDVQATPAVADVLQQIFRVKAYWNTLERPVAVTDFDPEQHLYNFSPFILAQEDQSSITYFPFFKDDGSLIGYPIGGTTLSEAGAYAVEYLYQKRTQKIRSLTLEKYFHYHFFPSLGIHFFQKLKLAFETSFLLSELTLSSGNPSEFLRVYEYFPSIYPQ